ncbi:hypothetical protein V6N12_050148 [Hibiscus sabdariffa]|uniref:RNase H type-1 domain-containing protein n=1 Tax=Hibiscus sabdariffa TaxID=183260 RepID=A0ABR2GBJ5_9ROSI
MRYYSSGPASLPPLLARWEASSHHIVSLLSQSLISSSHSLVRSISMVLPPTFGVHFVHIYRESNMVADFMIKLDAPFDGSLLSFFAPPSGLFVILNHDVLDLHLRMLGT